MSDTTYRASPSERRLRPRRLAALADAIRRRRERKAARAALRRITRQYPVKEIR